MPWLLIVIVLTAGAGCIGTEIDAALHRTVAVPERPVLLIFADGVHKPVFDKLLGQGRLPHTKRYLVDRGVTVRRATTVVPSITYAVTTSLLTGRAPGRHGIVGNAYFDRHQLVYRDYVDVDTFRYVTGDFRAATLHEILDDKYTVNILLPDSRGADRTFDNVLSVGPAWFFKMFDTVDALTSKRIGQLADEANACGRWPDLVVAYYPGSDETAHLWGTGSARYERILLNLDRQIGKIGRFLERNEILDRTNIVWVTDHGLTAGPNIMDAGKLFRERLGIPCIDKGYDEYEHSYVSRVNHFGMHRCVVVADGKRTIRVHLRVGARWAPRPSYAQIQAFGTAGAARFTDRLLAEPSVGVVLVRDGSDVVHVVSRTGHGRVWRVPEGGGYVYQVLEDGDPLGYADHPPAKRLMDGKPHTGRQWQAATYLTNYPDLVGQVVGWLDHQRTGDLVIFAAEGWHFNPGYKASHGGIDASDMRVPMFFAGPSLPPGTSIDYARTLDVAPTILGLMGLEDRIPRFNMDGVNLVPQLRQAKRHAKP